MAHDLPAPGTTAFRRFVRFGVLACMVAFFDPALAAGKGLVGIAMPTKSSPRWISDGNRLVKALTDKDYTADLQYADNDVPSQLAQVENMIREKVAVLVIAPIDGATLSATLQRAADNGIKVIAYDRLISGSKNVDYYVSFDNFQVGVLQANAIVDKLGLRRGRRPFNIELFGGSADDHNAFVFYEGAMAVLKPYLDSGALVVHSGQTGMDKVATFRWDGASARSRMATLIDTFYRTTRIDAVLSPYDGLSIGILSALKGAGYGTLGRPFPVVTGQDAEIASIKSMLRGEQTSTVFKDTRLLAARTVDMIESIAGGRQPELNDTKSYDNGVKVVPACLLKPVNVDLSNWHGVLIDSGYYTEDQLK